MLCKMGPRHSNHLHTPWGQDTCHIICQFSCLIVRVSDALAPNRSQWRRWKYIPQHQNILLLPNLSLNSFHVPECPLAQLNTLRPRQNGRHFADDIFEYIFLNQNVSISMKISLNFVSEGPIDNIPALVQIMAWRRPSDKPLSETMMVRLLTHICVTRPQWVNSNIDTRSES